MSIVGKNILVVGIADKGNALKELPVRLLVLDTNAQAINCLKEENIDTVISHWELIDAPAGKFLTNISEAKPSTPTIAFIKPGNVDQEIAARRLGVDSVLSEDIDDDYFRETVCQLLGISAVTSMQVAGNFNITTDKLYGSEFDK